MDGECDFKDYPKRQRTNSPVMLDTLAGDGQNGGTISEWLHHSDLFQNSKQTGMSLSGDLFDRGLNRSSGDVACFDDFCAVMTCIDYWGVFEWPSSVFSFISSNVATARQWRDSSGSPIAQHVNFHDEILRCVQTWEILIIASKLGSVGWLSHGHQCDYDVNAVDEFGNYPLHHAAVNGHCTVISALVKFGAKSNVCHYRSGGTVGSLAAKYGQCKVLRLLHELNIDIFTVNNGNNGETFFIAAKNGQLDVMHCLAELGSSLGWLETGTGLNAMDTAMKNGHIEVIKVLVDLGVAIEQPNNYGFRHAVVNDLYDVVHLFVELGGILSASMLKYNVFIASVGMIRYFYEAGVDLNVGGDKLLERVVYSCDVERIQVLVECGLAVNNADGKCPVLFEAAGISSITPMEPSIPVLRALLENGACIDGVISAVVRHLTGLYADVIVLLLEYGADVHEIDAEDGKTAVECLVDKGLAWLVDPSRLDYSDLYDQLNASADYRPSSPFYDPSSPCYSSSSPDPYGKGVL